MQANESPEASPTRPPIVSRRGFLRAAGVTALVSVPAVLKLPKLWTPAENRIPLVGRIDALTWFGATARITLQYGDRQVLWDGLPAGTEYMVSITDNVVRVWDVMTGKIVGDPKRI
jgi:hypothetical protein